MMSITLFSPFPAFPELTLNLAKRDPSGERIEYFTSSEVETAGDLAITFPSVLRVIVSVAENFVSVARDLCEVVS